MHIVYENLGCFLISRNWTHPNTGQAVCNRCVEQPVAKHQSGFSASSLIQYRARHSSSGKQQFTSLDVFFIKKQGLAWLSSSHMVLFTIRHLLFGSLSHHNVPMFPFEQLPQAELVEQILPPLLFPTKCTMQKPGLVMYVEGGHLISGQAQNLANSKKSTILIRSS